MAKKIQKRKKVVKKIKESLNAKEIKYLERLIELSLRNVNGKSEVLDGLFTKQAERLQKKISELNKA